jgi:hypothetical protein
MKTFILNDIPFQLDIELLRENFHINEGNKAIEDIKRLATYAEEIGKPKAIYGEAIINSKNDESVIVEGVELKSRVLRVNLEEAHRVFPYLITAGRELNNWVESIEDFLEKYWADQIQETIMRLARNFVYEHLNKTFKPGTTSSMNPGSLKGWQIQAQGDILSILGNIHNRIGVELTDSFLLVPVKSVAGIKYPTEFGFENCQLCQIENCPDRKSPFDKELYEKKYAGI